MVKNKELLELGCNRLIKQREVYKEMRATAKSVSEQLQLKLPTVMALKEYIHYNKADWEKDPFDPFEAKYKDKMVSPFRSVLKVIDNLRDTGSLYMLNPVIEALKERGINLSVDDNIKFKDNDVLIKFINMMSDNQTDICQLADERKEYRNQSKEIMDSTNTSYNQYVATYASYKVAKEKGKDTTKLEEKLQNLALNLEIDKDVYLLLDKDMKEGE